MSMIPISDDDLQLSVDLIALINVCSFASEYISDSRDHNRLPLTADISRCLEWARNLAVQVHDAMESAQDN